MVASKRPHVKVVKPVLTHSAKGALKQRGNEKNSSVLSVSATVTAGQDRTETIEISSGSDNDDGNVSDYFEESDVDDPSGDSKGKELLTNGHHTPSQKETSHVESNAERPEVAVDDESDGEPTFGDIVREQETVDVTALASRTISNDTAWPGDGSSILANGSVQGSLTKLAPGTVATAPTLASLSHLLSAALRSGDDANVEVCLNTTTDMTWVRNTIQRLDPSLAGILLQKLAARIHKRPGRAHSLIGWVQWTLITHGGALTSQPGVTRSLQDLHQVLEERARGLNSLLSLKGKLDMLEAQMQLRRGHRAGLRPDAFEVSHGRSRHPDRDGKDQVEASFVKEGNDIAQPAAHRGLSGGGGLDGATIYVEAQEANGSGRTSANGVELSAGSAEEYDEELADEDDSDVDDDDDGDRTDGEDEVEDLDGEELEDAEEIDFDDIDENDDDDDDDGNDGAESAPPPTKLQKREALSFSKRR